MYKPVDDCIHFFNKVDIDFVAGVLWISRSPGNTRASSTRERVTNVWSVSGYNAQHFADKVRWSYHFPQDVRFCCERETIIDHLIQKLQVTREGEAIASIVSIKVLEKQLSLNLTYKIQTSLNILNRFMPF